MRVRTRWLSTSGVNKKIKTAVINLIRVGKACNSGARPLSHPTQRMYLRSHRALAVCERGRRKGNDDGHTALPPFLPLPATQSTVASFGCLSV